ncbi:hypothetical protein AG4045_029838 [Apium graveolens]|uniref:Leucine-rich repeat-containing N-terminal plant-type domain-containing protein n=1 Tax=Apium graveolens TaxID=4045 RepID=A0A6L5BDD9_APIGR|nr:hypothetical protein AG4045_029838 [Apium graveolens]
MKFMFLKLMIFFSYAIIVEYTCSITTDQELPNKNFSGYNSSCFILRDLNCASPDILTNINLSSRNLIGSISWQFQKDMTHLQSIDFSNNSIQGHFPS